MHSLEVGWLLARLLARLVGLADTIDAAKIQPIRRNEDESTDGSLGSKIESMSKRDVCTMRHMCDMYKRTRTYVPREINSWVIGNCDSSLRIVSSSVLSAKRIYAKRREDGEIIINLK